MFSIQKRDTPDLSTGGRKFAAKVSFGGSSWEGVFATEGEREAFVVGVTSMRNAMISNLEE